MAWEAAATSLWGSRHPVHPGDPACTLLLQLQSLQLFWPLALVLPQNLQLLCLALIMSGGPLAVCGALEPNGSGVSLNCTDPTVVHQAVTQDTVWASMRAHLGPHGLCEPCAAVGMCGPCALRSTSSVLSSSVLSTGFGSKVAANHALAVPCCHSCPKSRCWHVRIHWWGQHVSMACFNRYSTTKLA